MSGRSAAVGANAPVETTVPLELAPLEDAAVLDALVAKPLVFLPACQTPWITLYFPVTESLS